MEHDKEKVTIALALIREYLSRQEISELVKLLNPPPQLRAKKKVLIEMVIGLNHVNLMTMMIK